MKSNQMLTRVLFVSLAGLLIVSFQNCSQTSFTQVDPSVSSSMQGDTQAIIHDDSGEIVQVVDSSAPINVDNNSTPPVAVQEPQEVVTDAQTAQTTPAPVQAGDNEFVDSIAGSSCLELSKKYNKTIDIASLPNDARIDIIQGQTFIFSSTGRNDLKFIAIGKASGRTILCGITIDTLVLKKGRLDLIESHVLNATEVKGTVKKDAVSTIIYK